MKNQITKQAEALFFAKGFNAVSLQDICSPLDIKPASLYYYFKGGKEEVYLEVIKQRTDEFRQNVVAIANRHENLESILKEFGYWYIAQPPMNMMIIAEIDVPYLSAEGKKSLNGFVASAVFEPLGKVFLQYQHALRPGMHPFSLVGTLSVLLFSIHTSLKMGDTAAKELVDYNIDLFLNGVAQKN